MPAEIRRDSRGAVIFPETGTGHTLFERLKTEVIINRQFHGMVQECREMHGIAEHQAADALTAVCHQRLTPQDRAAPGVDDPVMLRILSVGFHNGFR